MLLCSAAFLREGVPELKQLNMHAPARRQEVLIVDLLAAVAVLHGDYSSISIYIFNSTRTRCHGAMLLVVGATAPYVDR